MGRMSVGVAGSSHHAGDNREHPPEPLGSLSTSQMSLPLS